MSIHQRPTGHRREVASKSNDSFDNHSRSSKVAYGCRSASIQACLTSWTWTAFTLTCAAVLLSWLYWAPALTRIPILFSSPEPRESGPGFVVSDLPGRGKGMIAVRDIRRGELLIREPPLILVPRQITTSPSQLILDLVQQLSPDQAASFYNLSHVNLPQGLSSEEFTRQLPLAIFQTNSVAAGPNVGLFPTMARLNHGCSHAFNSVYSWREREEVLVVHALKDIKRGEELLTAYFRTQQSREERRYYLKQNYGFHCMCACCALPDKESKISDDRLTTMSDLYKRLSTWGEGVIDGSEAIRIVKRIWALGEEEGYTSERGRLAADASLVAATLSDAEAVVEWAKLGLQWASYELGSDSDLAEEMRIVISGAKGGSVSIA
ncbi:hypothetical protein B0F90DRAFT_1705391 [Multifurca ochricompacta]|uniref:SET domain-containing protein n=1 Tax=Multifurca ochricompacta TaxID=376703 RepID=A0AAD4QNV5_9AGAM|nr:hypothetical protein B0F90DRAFT_1705391 [Multifurca ochricompacta]